MEQLVHSAQEALSAYTNGEDARCVFDDLVSVQLLLEHVLKSIHPMAKGLDR
jgi:hypothetical protein